MLLGKTTLFTFVSIPKAGYNSPMEIETKQEPIPDQESIWDLIRFALVVLVIALGVRYFIAQPFVVSGESMVPTFQNKNYLIVDQLTYRFKTPERGDVIIFHPPGQPKGIYYIKRIIGLPGEIITVKGGIVTITNTEHPDGWILNEPYISAPTTLNVENKKIEEEEYFVMGDNRPFSSDSRTWGVLPKENIIGRAFLRLFPLKSISALPGEYDQYTAN